MPNSQPDQHQDTQPPTQRVTTRKLHMVRVDGIEHFYWELGPALDLLAAEPEAEDVSKNTAGEPSKEEPTPTQPEEQSKPPTCWKRFVDFYWSNEFLILIVVVILLARVRVPGLYLQNFPQA